MAGFDCVAGKAEISFRTWYIFKWDIIIFQASDVGSSMFVHVFGAYFGLAVNFVLQRNPIHKQLEKEASPLPPRSIVSATVGIK